MHLVVGDAHRPAPFAIGDPRLGHVDPDAHAKAAALTCQMQAHGDLAVVLATERSRVLALHAHRMSPLLGEPRVVDHPGLQFGQLHFGLERQAFPHLLVGPRADRHALLKALAHRLNLGLVINEPPRHRLDALAVAIEQKSREVVPHRLPALGSPHTVRHRVEVGRQLTVESLQLALVHPNGRSRRRIGVKKTERVVLGACFSNTP